MNSEMPSTPRCQPIPHCSIHVCWDTNWNPASLVSNEASNQILIAAVVTEASSPINFAYSGRDRCREQHTECAHDRHEDQCRENRKGARSATCRQHHRIPRITTNQVRSNTTPTPMTAAY